MSRTAVQKSTRTKTTPYDVAEHLGTPEEMAAYLDAWLEEAPDDAAGIARAFGDIARAKGMSQAAKDAVLNHQSLAEDAEDLAAFAARAEEPSLAFEDVLGDLKRRSKT